MQRNSGLQCCLKVSFLHDLLQNVIGDNGLPRGLFAGMSVDRGQNIRTEQMYRQLAGNVFKHVNAWIETKPLRIPYVIVVLECQD